MKRRNIATVLGMAAFMGLALTACQKSNSETEALNNTASREINTEAPEESAQAPETVTVPSLNGSKEPVNVEVPFNPQRVAVLDMAILDMMDSLDLGDRVVGMAKGSAIDYLSHYSENEEIANLGTLKEVDLEALMSCEPEVIFIGGRLSGQYDALSKIAPVVYLSTDYEIGLLESVKKNASAVASIFGAEEKSGEKFQEFDFRIEALAEAASGKTAVIGMVTSSNFNTLGDDSRCSVIGNEIGFENLAGDTDSTHGNESSFELLVKLDPEYLFVLDRDSAIQTEGAKLAREIMENELVQKTKAYQNGNIVYLTPSVWYLAEGGLTATDQMLKDLEGALLKES